MKRNFWPLAIASSAAIAVTLSTEALADHWTCYWKSPQTTAWGKSADKNAAIAAGRSRCVAGTSKTAKCVFNGCQSFPDKTVQPSGTLPVQPDGSSWAKPGFKAGKDISDTGKNIGKQGSDAFKNTGKDLGNVIKRW